MSYMLVSKLLDTLGSFLYQDLARCRSCSDNLVSFSRGSWHEDLGHGLYRSLWIDFVEILVTCCFHDFVQVRVRRSCRGPVRSFRCPCMISYRSLWEDLVKIRLRSSSRGPCIKVLQMLCVCACVQILQGCSWEVLVCRYCEIFY